jgi:hypothetical protein
MEESEKPVQNTVISGEKGDKKKRSQADKIGKLKYLLAKDKKLDRDIAEIKLWLKVIFAGLKDSLHFERSFIEEAACCDEVDKSILQFLIEAGAPGMLSKDIAAKLVEFKIARHQVVVGLFGLINGWLRNWIQRLLSGEVGVGLWERLLAEEMVLHSASKEEV